MRKKKIFVFGDEESLVDPCTGLMGLAAWRWETSETYWWRVHESRLRRSLRTNWRSKESSH